MSLPSMASAVVVYVRAMITVLIGGSNYQLNAPISFSSVDYTVEEDVDGGASGEAWPEPAPAQEPWPEPSQAQEPWPEPAQTQDPWPESNQKLEEASAWTADFQNAVSGPQSTTSLEQEFGKYIFLSLDRIRCGSTLGDIICI